jgi:predicted MFS family arabinose efflux permease
VFSFGIPIGSALGIVAGGLLASLIDWRVAFFAVGLAGLLFAPVFRAIVREPERGHYDPAGAKVEPAALGHVMRTLIGKKSFWLLCCGAACSSMMGYGLFFWLPSFLIRSYGITLIEASLFYGAILLVGGIAGIWLGGALADRFGRAKKSAYALVPAIAFAATVPFFVGGVLSPTLWLTGILLLLPTALGLAWLGPILSAIQHVVPPSMRATASAASAPRWSAPSPTASPRCTATTRCATPSSAARRSTSSPRCCSSSPRRGSKPTGRAAEHATCACPPPPARAYLNVCLVTFDGSK